MEQNPKRDDRILDFYEGKTIFMTGAAGYLGSILLEILLRCLPGIQAVYVLLRPKKGVDAYSRKDLIFQKPIFKRLLDENPSIADKVHVVRGDVTEAKLGMSEEDEVKLIQNATIVFHVAAIVSFFKPLKYTAIHNSLGTKHVIELCKKLRNCEAFVYTSTAYSNCNRHPDIEEIVYRLPFKTERFFEELQKGEKFEQLASACKPSFPNNYTFSKCLAENAISDMAPNLPVAIIRPSIIVATWKGPLPSYIEEGTGLVDFSIAVGKGFARIVHGDPNSQMDLIPSDMVANAHVVAAWGIASNRLATPLVVNCTGGHKWKVSFGHYCDTLENMANNNMLPKTFQEPCVRLVGNKYTYLLYCIYEHYIPALVLDTVLSLRGSQLRLLPLYKFFENIMKELSYFITKTFHFQVNNFNALTDNLKPEEREVFYMDLENVDLKKMVDRIPQTNKFYDWKNDKKSQEARKRIVYVRTVTITFIKRLILMLLFLVIYISVSKLL